MPLLLACHSSSLAMAAATARVRFRQASAASMTLAAVPRSTSEQQRSGPATDPLSSFIRNPGAFSLSRRVAMARDATATAVPALRPWLVDVLPLLVVLLIATHVLALVYWIYRLATDGSRQPTRSKKR